MRPLEALSAMMKSAELNRSTLARKLGKNSSYVRKYYSRGSLPSIDNFRIFADACGWDLFLESRKTKERILITAENEDSIESYL